MTATVSEVNRRQREIEDLADGWATGDHVDWESFLDRVEADLLLDLGSDLNSPTIRRVLAIGRRVRREARA